MANSEGGFNPSGIFTSFSRTKFQIDFTENQLTLVAKGEPTKYARKLLS